MMARRPIELTPAQKAEVETLAAVLTTEQIADFFGIGRTTFFAMMTRDEEIAERYKKGKARAIGAIAQGLIAKARGGDTTSMIFYLKTQAGWRETAGLELSGPRGGPIKVDETRTNVQRFIERIERLRDAALAAEAVSTSIAGTVTPPEVTVDRRGLP